MDWYSSKNINWYSNGVGGGSNIIPLPIVIAPNATSATVSWAAIDGATGYEVFAGPSETGPWTSEGTTTEIEYLLTGLTPNATIYASVQATVVSSKGVVSFVTTAASPIPLVQWVQIEGGMQYGGAFEGGCYLVVGGS